MSESWLWRSYPRRHNQACAEWCWPPVTRGMQDGTQDQFQFLWSLQQQPNLSHWRQDKRSTARDWHEHVSGMKTRAFWNLFCYTYNMNYIYCTVSCKSPPPPNPNTKEMFLFILSLRNCNFLLNVLASMYFNLYFFYYMPNSLHNCKFPTKYLYHPSINGLNVCLFHWSWTVNLSFWKNYWMNPSLISTTNSVILSGNIRQSARG